MKKVDGASMMNINVDRATDVTYDKTRLISYTFSVESSDIETRAVVNSHTLLAEFSLGSMIYHKIRDELRKNVKKY
jgi:hypothetical protein